MPWRCVSFYLQGIIFLAPADASHVPCDSILILTVISELLLLSFTPTAFGVRMTARISQRRAFMALTKVARDAVVLPVGRSLPAWRTRSPERVAGPGEACPPGIEAVTGAGLPGLAIAEFRRTE
jgi:hypothetical protein